MELGSAAADRAQNYAGGKFESAAAGRNHRFPERRTAGLRLLPNTAGRGEIAPARICNAGGLVAHCVRTATSNRRRRLLRTSELRIWPERGCLVRDDGLGSPIRTAAISERKI